MAKKRSKKPNFSKLSTEELKAAFRSDFTNEERLAWQGEIQNREEPLLKKYHKYLEPGGFMGELLRHPLYNAYCNSDRAAFVNWLIERKEEKIEELATKNKWYDVVFMHEIPFLVETFVKYVERFDDKNYWKLLAAVWIHQEQLWPNRKLMLNLFQSPRPERRWLMTAAERRKLENLPDEFPIYRGFIGRRGKGLSWTIEKKKAEWFAKRFAVLEELGKPKLMEGVAKKKDVLAYFNGRKEKEIVIDPDKVTKVKTSAIALDPEENLD